MTPKIVTRYYRPPEIIMISRNYGKGVDLWSLGCTIAEILQNGEILFQEDNELQILNKIFSIRGTPNKSNWEGWKNFKQCLEFT